MSANIKNYDCSGYQDPCNSWHRSILEVAHSLIGNFNHTPIVYMYWSKSSHRKYIKQFLSIFLNDKLMYSKNNHDYGGY
jgi:hypothetical protein